MWASSLSQSHHGTPTPPPAPAGPARGSRDRLDAPGRRRCRARARVALWLFRQAGRRRAGPGRAGCRNILSRSQTVDSSPSVAPLLNIPQFCDVEEILRPAGALLHDDQIVDRGDEERPLTDCCFVNALRRTIRLRARASSIRRRTEKDRLSSGSRGDVSGPTPVQSMPSVSRGCTDDIVQAMMSLHNRNGSATIGRCAPFTRAPTTDCRYNPTTRKQEMPLFRGARPEALSAEPGWRTRR